jgi:hypothetical protein
VLALLVPASPAAAAIDECGPSPFGPELAWTLAERWPNQRFTAAVVDLVDGCEYHLHPGMQVTTASVFKVEVLAGVLLRAQDEGRPLSAWEAQRVRPMIAESANPPTNELFASLGGVAGIARLHDRLGLRETRTPTGTWGLTSTTARDQLHLLRQLLVDGGGLFDDASRQRAWDEMTSVVPSQRWGVTEAVPRGWPVALKNGFAGSSSNGWRLNSVGKIGDEWLVAVLTDGWPDEASGIEANRFVNRAIATRIARMPIGSFYSAGSYVENLYRHLFHREADWGGRILWTAALHEGAPPDDLEAWLRGTPEYRAANP